MMASSASHAPLPSPRDSRLALLAFAGVALFAIVCFAAQFARGDLDWVQSPLSFYLVGDYGTVVKSAYVALGAALVSLGIEFRRSTSGGALAFVAPILFTVAGIALVVTAFSETGARAGAITLARRVHGLAAMTTFLSVTIAMLVQSIRLRRNVAWRGRFRAAVPLAIASFVALLGHAFLHIGPRGLSQKVVIVLILAWLGIASIRLRAHASAGNHE